MQIAKADGAIYIDTKIDVDGFTAGSKELESAARRAATAVNGIGEKAKASLQKQADAFAKQNSAYEQQRQKVEDLKNKLNELSGQKVETDAFKSASADVAELEQKINELIDNQKKFVEIGGDVKSNTFQSMDRELEKTIKKMNAANTKKKELLSSGGAYQAADTSGVEQKLSAESEKLRLMQGSLATSYDALISKVSEYGNAEKETEPKTSRLSSAIDFLKRSMVSLLGISKKLVGGSFKLLKGVVRSLASGIKKLSSGFLRLFKNSSKLNSGVSGGVKSLLKYGIGLRLLSTLFSKFKSAIKDGFANLSRFDIQTNGSISALTSSLKMLKNSLATAFSPILNVVSPILASFINLLAKAATYVGMFFAAITGQTSFTKAVGIQEDYAASLEETSGAAKDAAKNLSGLDEINTWQGEKDSGGGGVSLTPPSDMFETIPVTSISFDSWGDSFSRMIDKILVDGIPRLKGGLSSIALWINNFSANLYEMFTFPGVYEKIVSLGAEISSALNDFFIATDWASIGGVLGSGVNLMLGFIVSSIYNFDWGSLGSSVATIMNNTISQIDWETFGSLLWAKFKIVLESLAGFLLNLDMAQLAQAASNVAIGFFNSMSETIQNIDWSQIAEQIKIFLVNVDWGVVAEAVFTAIGSAFGAAASLLWELIKDAWDRVINWWNKNAYKDGQFTIKGLLSGILDVIKNIGKWIYDHIFKPFIDGFKKVFGIHSPSTVMAEQGQFIMEGLFNGISALIEKIVNIFKTLWNKIKYVFAKVGEWFGNIFSGAVNAIKNAFSSVGSFFSGVWNGIKNAFGNVTGWFQNVFTKAWSAVKKVFSAGGKIFDGIKDGILNGLKAVINALIRGINKVISIPFDGINWALSKIRGISILGIEPFSWITTFDVPQIPLLATGAVIPPNAPFAAILGDQKRGTNIEAPLSTIEDAVENVLRRNSAFGAGGGSYRFTAQINRRTIFDEVIAEAKLRQMSTGNNPFQLA